jgi:predicted MFS family arabinose efflux permease
VRAGADALGALLVTAGLMLGVYAIVGTARYGWGSAHTLVLAGIAVLLLAAFIVRQAKGTAATPLLPLRIFSARGVVGANLAQILVIAAAFGFQVLITLYAQRVLGYGPSGAGLGLLPTAIVIAVISLGVSARLISRFGERGVLVAGLALIVVALALLSRADVSGGLGGYAVHLLPALLVFGAGGRLILPALATLGMSDATPSDAGLASGLFNTTQQIGAALGVAVLSTLAAARTAHLRATGLNASSSLTGGYHVAFGIAACLGAAALVVALTVLRPRSPRNPPPGEDRARADVSTRAAARCADRG